MKKISLALALFIIPLALCAQVRNFETLQPDNGDDDLATSQKMLKIMNLPTHVIIDSGSNTAVLASDTAPTLFRATSQGVTKATVVTGAHGLFAYNFVNPNAYPVYVKLYDALVAGVTVGTTTPKTTLSIPSGGVLLVENRGVPQLAFATGITIAVTKLLADSDTTALDTPILAEISYK